MRNSSHSPSLMAAFLRSAGGTESVRTASDGSQLASATALQPALSTSRGTEANTLSSSTRRSDRICNGMGLEPSWSASRWNRPRGPAANGCTSTTTTNSRPSTSAPATFARPRPRSSTFPTWTPTEPLEPTHDGIEAHNSERGLTITPGTCVPRCYGDALEVDWTVAGLHEAQARTAP